MWTLSGINWVSILIATVVVMVIGWAWYSDMLFGKDWLGMIGKSKDDLKKNAGMGYGGALVLTVVTATVLALLIKALGIHGYLEGAKLGVLIWLGFIATTTGVGMLFEGSRKKLWLINNGNQLVNLIVIGAIIAGMG